MPVHDHGTLKPETDKTKLIGEIIEMLADMTKDCYTEGHGYKGQTKRANEPCSGCKDAIIAFAATRLLNWYLAKGVTVDIIDEDELWDDFPGCGILKDDMQECLRWIRALRSLRQRSPEYSSPQLRFDSRN